MAWIEAIRTQTAILTPGVRRTPSGETVCTFDGKTGPQHAVLFAYVPGTAPADRIKTSSRLGRIAVTLHRHAATWAMPPGFTRPVWDLESVIGANAHWERWQDNGHVGAPEQRVLRAAVTALRRRIAAYGRPSRRWGLIHGDMRQANLLVDAAATRVIDFDDCGFSSHMYALPCTLPFIEDRADTEEIVAAWLAAYRTAVTLMRTTSGS